ncbi:MAG: aldo/keto reductase [Steroidobacteraceae bacterium]
MRYGRPTHARFLMKGCPMDLTSRTCFSRRRLLTSGALVGAGLALPGWAAWAAETATLPLITKKIPSSGELLPVIGTGTNAYGVTDPAQRAQIKEVLKNLPQLGGKVVDTARAYGTSELVIGELVQELGNRDQLFIATKTPMSSDLSAGSGVLVETFNRLRMERLDLVEIHNFHGIDELMPVLLEFRQAKKIRYIGCTTSSRNQHAQMLEAMKKHKLDFIQTNYSIADRSSNAEILPLALERGIAVLNNVPFGGVRGNFLPKLMGKPLPPFAAAEFDVTSWPQLCLKYNISHPAITAAIPGTTTLEYLRDNQRAGRGRLPDAAARRKLEVYWETLGV